MDSLETKIESLIFCSPKPIKISEIKETIKENDGNVYQEKQIHNLLNSLIKKYDDDSYSFKIVESGGGFQFLTKNK